MTNASRSSCFGLNPRVHQSGLDVAHQRPCGAIAECLHFGVRNLECRDLIKEEQSRSDGCQPMPAEIARSLTRPSEMPARRNRIRLSPTVMLALKGEAAGLRAECRVRLVGLGVPGGQVDVVRFQRAARPHRHAATPNATGARYDQDYVSVLDLRGGLISRHRDYWNPPIVLAADGPDKVDAVL